MTTAIRTKWLVLVTIGVLLAAGAIAWAFFAIPPSSLPMTIGGSSAGQLLQAAQDNNANLDSYKFTIELWSRQSLYAGFSPARQCH